MVGKKQTKKALGCKKGISRPVEHTCKQQREWRLSAIVFVIVNQSTVNRDSVQTRYQDFLLLLHKFG